MVLHWDINLALLLWKICVHLSSPTTTAPATMITSQGCTVMPSACYGGCRLNTCLCNNNLQAQTLNCHVLETEHFGFKSTDLQMNGRGNTLMGVWRSKKGDSRLTDRYCPRHTWCCAVMCVMVNVGNKVMYHICCQCSVVLLLESWHPVYFQVSYWNFTKKSNAKERPLHAVNVFLTTKPLSREDKRFLKKSSCNWAR